MMINKVKHVYINLDEVAAIMQKNKAALNSGKDEKILELDKMAGEIEKAFDWVVSDNRIEHVIFRGHNLVMKLPNVHKISLDPYYVRKYYVSKRVSEEYCPVSLSFDGDGTSNMTINVLNYSGVKCYTVTYEGKSWAIFQPIRKSKHDE